MAVSRAGGTFRPCTRCVRLGSFGDRGGTSDGAVGGLSYHRISISGGVDRAKWRRSEQAIWHEQRQDRGPRAGTSIGHFDHRGESRSGLLLGQDDTVVAAPLRPLPIPTGFSWAAGSCVRTYGNPRRGPHTAVAVPLSPVARPGRDVLRPEFTSVVSARRCNRNARSQVIRGEPAAGASAVMMSSSRGFSVRVGPGLNRRARVQGVGVFGGTGRG